MAKRIAAILTALVLCLVANGQNKGKTDFFGNAMKNRALQAENQKYKAQVDSLIRIIDSLKTAKAADDKIIEEYIPEVILDKKPRSVEEADSLAHLWRESMRIQDYIAIEDYNMDSLKFSSDVPDSVMIHRIEQMNPYFTLPYNETVRNYMILYTEKGKKKMGTMIGRCQYYMPLFEEAFNRYDLPLELKYMSIIESSLNPTARSRTGAMGMWQFMYKTARAYGLRINSFVDERLDVEKAVDAAARYLRDAYKTFGDWSLAISSYNCGSGNVLKAMKRSGSSDFWDIYTYLPRETRGYMPAFVGAMYALTYYKEYGIIPDNTGVPAQVDTFEIHRNLHFRQINEVVGVPMEILEEFNPQYIHSIIPALSPGEKDPYILRLPTNWSNAFLSADQDSLYNHRASQLVSPQVLKNIKENGGDGTRITYKVKNGDYLGRIASKYHVSVDNIMKWNHLRSSSLRIGQVLYIYPKGTSVASADAQAQAAKEAEAEAARAAQAAQSETQTEEAEQEVKEEAEAEQEAEQEAVIETMIETALDTTLISRDSIMVRRDSVVVKKDSISVKKDTTHNESADLLKSALMKASQQRAAEDKAAEAKAEAERAAELKAAEQKAAQQKAAEAAKAPKYTSYTVKVGDTLYKISKNYPGVSIQEIMELNRIDTSIRPGMTLKIPVK